MLGLMEGQCANLVEDVAAVVLLVGICIAGAGTLIGECKRSKDHDRLDQN
jgi:hypothetical protein